MLLMYRLFADDNSLQHALYNISDIESNLNRGLHVLEKWSCNGFLNSIHQKQSCIFFLL